jgi:hypothetical protein
MEAETKMLLTKKEMAEYAFDLQVGLNGADVPEFDAARLLGTAAVLAVNLRGLGEVNYSTLRLVAAYRNCSPLITVGRGSGCRRGRCGGRGEPNVRAAALLQ